MPVIRIDDEVMNELKRKAIEWGFVFEPPNTTLRKILNLEKGTVLEAEEVHLAPSMVQAKPSGNFHQGGVSNRRSAVKWLLRPGVKARYLQNGNMVVSADTPTKLARSLRIRPAKYVLGGHAWDNVTYGTEGYRTTVHSFTANGYEVDIGDGWGQYAREEMKPYAKFDVRKKA